MYIRIGSFSKRHNSTKQPAANWGTRLNVDLKEDCSMEEPVFKLGFSAWNPAYNYIYAEDWNRYYFVVNVTVNIGRIWEVQCKLDTAGTYRSDITGSTQYVVYAAVANSEIIDARIPIETTKSISAVETPLSDFCNATGTYILTVSGSGGDANDTNGPTSYSLTIGALNNVMSSVKQYIEDLGSQDTDTFEAILTIGRQLVGCGHITENILGCTWIPWNVSAMGDVALEDIYLGVFNTGKSGYALKGAVKSYTTTISIPWQVSDWRRNSPYTQVYLYIPFVGIVQLSSENLIGESEISVTVSINRLNGNCNFKLMAGNQILGTYSAATGIGIPVGASGISGETAAIGALAHSAAMIAGVAGHPLLAAGAGAVAAVSHIAPNSITAGNLSGGASVGLGLNLRCFTVLHDTVVTPGNLRATIGEPYNRAVTLSSLSGYVQTQNASVQGANMSDAARQEINAMCDGGIYIE